MEPECKKNLHSIVQPLRLMKGNFSPRRPTYFTNGIYHRNAWLYRWEYSQWIVLHCLANDRQHRKQQQQSIITTLTWEGFPLNDQSITIISKLKFLFDDRVSIDQMGSTDCISWDSAKSQRYDQFICVATSWRIEFILLDSTGCDGAIGGEKYYIEALVIMDTLNDDVSPTTGSRCMSFVLDRPVKPWHLMWIM